MAAPTVDAIVEGAVWRPKCFAGMSQRKVLRKEGSLTMTKTLALSA